MAAPNGLIVAWPSTAASIPAGWSRYTALDDRVPKPASSSITSTGGSDTHDHPTASHSHSDNHNHSSTSSGASSSFARDSQAGSATFGINGSHNYNINDASGLTTGSASGTSNTGSSIGFSRFSVIWIQSDGTTDIPTNAVAWSNQGTVPTGWSAFASGINAFLRGAATGANGGTATSAASHNHTYSHQHTHSSGSHSHTPATPSSSLGTASNFTGGASESALTGSHSHTTTGSQASATHGTQNTGADNATADNQTPEPSWYKLQTVQASGAALAPNGIIALWTTTSPPSGWVACDGANGSPNINGSGRFIKGANGTGEIGNTGGSSTHTHSGSHSHTADTSTGTHAVGTVSLSAPSGSTGLTDGTAAAGQAAQDGHTHAGGTTGNRSGSTSPDSVTYSANSSNDPAYVQMFFIMAFSSGSPFRKEMILAPFKAIWRRTGETSWNTPIRLIGQDRLYGAPGQVNEIEIPRAHARPRHYDKTISNNALRMRGLDTIFGAPGQAPDIEIPPAPERPRHYAKDLFLGYGPDNITVVKVPSIEIPPAARRPRHYAKDIFGSAYPDNIIVIKVPAIEFIPPAERLRHFAKDIFNAFQQDLVVFPQPPAIEIPAAHSRPRHYAWDFSTSAAPYRIVIIKPPPIEIIHHQRRPHPGDAIPPFNNTILQDLFKPGPPVRPVEIIGFQVRPQTHIYPNIVNLLFFLPPPPHPPDLDIYVAIREIEQYLHTLEFPVYTDTIQYEVYVQSYEYPIYTDVLKYTPPNQTRSL